MLQLGDTELVVAALRRLRSSAGEGEYFKSRCRPRLGGPRLWMRQIGSHTAVRHLPKTVLDICQWRRPEHILRAHSRMGRSSFGGTSSREEMSFAQNLWTFFFSIPSSASTPPLAVKAFSIAGGPHKNTFVPLASPKLCVLAIASCSALLLT